MWGFPLSAERGLKEPACDVPGAITEHGAATAGALVLLSFWERMFRQQPSLHDPGANSLVSERSTVTGYRRAKRKCETERLGGLYFVG